MKKTIFILAALIALAQTGCGKKRAPLDPLLQKAHDAVAEGKYDLAISTVDQIIAQVPTPAHLADALYLKAYVLAYGKADFQAARMPLHQIVDFYPQHPMAAESLKLMSDCYYWQGNYRQARKSYRKLMDMTKDRWGAYGLVQTGHCLLLEEKPGDALTSYREAVEKYPTDPLSDSAQLMVANLYLKLENPAQAKTELQKLLSVTRNSETRKTAKLELQRIDEESTFKRGVSTNP